ncbi:putative protein tag-278 [Macrobrachium nipponense]|uniref:putative protein tag-278 n=1 Tax=Macrobrachium nipponense TaxID=159736 RepID=UPI0030C7BC2D
MNIKFVTPNMFNMSAGFGDYCALPLLAVLILFILFTGCDFSSFTGGRKVVNNLAEKKQSYKREIENFRVEQKDKIEVLEYENNPLKEVVLAQTIAMHQRNREIESLIKLVEGIRHKSTNSGEEKEGEGDSPKYDARLERLHRLILEMSSEMVGLRLDIEEKVDTISKLNGEVSRREKCNEELAEEIQRKDERHREMENRLATANEKIVMLQRELLNEQNKTKLSEKGPAEKDNSIESLTTCNVQRPVDGKTKTSEELQELRGEVAAANAKIDRLQEDNCLKEKRLSEVERRLEHLASQFEERNAAAAAETLKMEGPGERLREERHSQETELCEISAPFHQSLLGAELAIELGRLKDQLSKDKERRIQFTRMGGHVETPGQLQSSEANDSLNSIIECLNGKELEEVLRSTDMDTKSLSEAIDHLLKLVTQENTKSRAAASQMVADLKKQKRLLGFRGEDMAKKVHLDTHIHVLNKARGKDMQTQLDKILGCMCQSKPAAEDVNIPENNAPIAQKDLLMTNERDSFQVEGAAFSWDEEALRRDRKILNKELMSHLREKVAFSAERKAFATEREAFAAEREAFAAEREAFNKNKEKLDEDKNALQRQLEKFEKEKESINRLFHELILFEQTKAIFYQEREELEKVKEAVYKREQVANECLMRVEKLMGKVEGREDLNGYVKNENEVQMEQKIEELEEIIRQQQTMLEKCEATKCELLQVIQEREALNGYVKNENEVQMEQKIEELEEIIRQQQTMLEKCEATKCELLQVIQEREALNGYVKNENEVQMEQKIEELEEIIRQQQTMLEKCEATKCELLQVIQEREALNGYVKNENEVQMEQKIEELEEIIRQQQTMLEKCEATKCELLQVIQEREDLNGYVKNENEVQMEQKIEELEEIIRQQQTMLEKCETTKCELLQAIQEREDLNGYVKNENEVQMEQKIEELEEIIRQQQRCSKNFRPPKL